MPCLIHPRMVFSPDAIQSMAFMMPLTMGDVNDPIVVFSSRMECLAEPAAF